MRLLHRVPAETLAIAVIYFLLARLGLHFATISLTASPVWPASGFAIGIMIVLGTHLSISKKILTSHGGQLIYDGGRQHTCFVMILPRLASLGRAA